MKTMEELVGTLRKAGDEFQRLHSALAAANERVRELEAKCASHTERGIALTKHGELLTDEMAKQRRRADALESELAALRKPGPRVVDDALVDSIAEHLHDIHILHKDTGKCVVRIVLEGLPPNLTQPVELTDEEASKLWTAGEKEGLAGFKRAYAAALPNDDLVIHNDITSRVRGILAAAGRYTPPVECRNCELQVCSAHQPPPDRLPYVAQTRELHDRPHAEGKLIASHQLNSDRLPYVGLTKEDAYELRDVMFHLRDGWLAEAIRIIAKALGAGGGK